MCTHMVRFQSFAVLLYKEEGVILRPWRQGDMIYLCASLSRAKV